VAQLLEALRKVADSIPEGVRGTFIYISFRPHYGLGVNSAFNINEYQEYLLGGGGVKGGRCVGPTTLPSSYAGCLDI